MFIEKRDNNQYFADGIRINQQELFDLLKLNPNAIVVTGHQKINITYEVKKHLQESLWSEEELKILKNNFAKVPLKKLAVLLPNKRLGQLRNKASMLNLTVEKDLWTLDEDKNLLELRRYHVPFSTVAKLLNRSERSCEVRSHRLSGTHPEGIKSRDSHDAGRNWFKNNVHSSIKGRVAELLVSVELALRGADVFEPFYPQNKVDLLAYVSGKPYKIQVKSSVFMPGTNRFRLPLMVKNPRTHTRISYTPDEVDFFVAVCLGPQMAFYVIPFDDVKTRADLNFYPHRAVSGQADRIGMEKYRDAWHLIVGNIQTEIPQISP